LPRLSDRARAFCGRRTSSAAIAQGLIGRAPADFEKSTLEGWLQKLAAEHLAAMAQAD
jgi:hypothetical protein